MKKSEADEIIERLLAEAADDEQERVEAGRRAIERFSRLPDSLIAKAVKEQQLRQSD